MFYVYLLPLILLGLGGGVKAECLTDYWNKRCLTKSQMPSGFGFYFESGDPCFQHLKKRYCFVSTNGNMEPCKCSTSCGCRTPPPPVKCDMRPQRPDCRSDKQQYCPITYTDYYGRTHQHTMCTYCGVDMSQCYQICARGLTPAEKQLIVNYHNELRSKVANGQERRGYPGPQPDASDMYELKWSDELAKIAQTWTDQCLYEHDKNRLTSTKQYAGQNIAAKWTPKAISDKGLKDKIKGWYDEVKDWPSYNVAQFSTSGTRAEVRHYTQLVWANSKFIGCGFITNYDTDPTYSSYPYRQMLVCNYSPGGNIAGQPVYNIGRAGSKCPRGTSKGLCRH